MYLDAWRFLAALIVVIYHIGLAGIGSFGQSIGKYGHTMVMVFFVFSGYIIVRTTLDRAIDARAYAVLRASRIYAVAVPAIVLSALTTWLLAWVSPSAVAAQGSWHPIDLRAVLSSLLFVNQSWQNLEGLSLDVPYWSLCYEAWYYVVFGVFYFSRGAWRLIFAGLAALVAGPAVICLMPVWIAGALLAWVEIEWRPPAWLGVLLAGTSALLIVAIVETGSDIAIERFVKARLPFVWHLGFSTRMVSDFLVGLAVCVHLFAVGQLTGAEVGPRRGFEGWRPLTKTVAAFSFSLYLFHDPILRSAGSLGLRTGSDGHATVLLLVLTVTACWLLSRVTEARTPRLRAWMHERMAPNARVAAP